MGRIFDDPGNRMTPVHTRKGFLRYRYYVSVPCEGKTSGSVKRVPAARAEEAVIGAVRDQLHIPNVETTDDASQPNQQELTTPQNVVETYVERVVVSKQGLAITLSAGDRGTSTKNTIKVPLYVRGRTTLREINPGKDQTGRHKTLRAERRLTLLTTIAKARQWVDELSSGRVADITNLADREGCSERNIRRALSLAFLAPDIVQAAIDGELPPDLVMTRISSVDNHWGSLFKAAVLSTILSVGSEAGTSNSENNLAQAIRQGASQSIGQAGEQVVGRSLNVQPTITVRPGLPINVLVTRDLILEPYRK